jgi:glycerol-3-phosphate acyltransferase PlsY
LIVIVAYLLGSIPFGFLIVRAKAGADIRDSGSGGTGATNVSRRAGMAAGVLTLLLDALKGSAAILIASRISGEDSGWLLTVAAISVVVGHIFPIWLGFRGGKGVATAVGVFLVLAPVEVAIAGMIFLATVWRTRYVSLGSIVAAITIPILLGLKVIAFKDVLLYPTLVAATVCAVLIVFAHRQNVARLVNGTENKFKS